MTTSLVWSGCRHVRDLGGLPTDHAAASSPGGWSARTPSTCSTPVSGRSGSTAWRGWSTCAAWSPASLLPERTGAGVALLLEVAGVPREHVVADYAASEVHLGVLEVVAPHPDTEARARLAESARTRP